MRSIRRRGWTGVGLWFAVWGTAKSQPLDNNLCERAFKKAILHRKNPLFYKTENGAHVGDLYMSLIHTCQLCGANPFDYLTVLQQHGEELSRNAEQWMPWNYANVGTDISLNSP